MQLATLLSWRSDVAVLYLLRGWLPVVATCIRQTKSYICLSWLFSKILGQFQELYAHGGITAIIFPGHGAAKYSPLFPAVATNSQWNNALFWAWVIFCNFKYLLSKFRVMVALDSPRSFRAVTLYLPASSTVTFFNSKVQSHVYLSNSLVTTWK